MATSFVIRPFFFEDHSTAGPVICIVTPTHFKSKRRFVYSELDQRGILHNAIYMQDGESTAHWYIGAARLLKQHFGIECIIGQNLSTSWPTQSPDLNQCHFLV